MLLLKFDVNIKNKKATSETKVAFLYIMSEIISFSRIHLLIQEP